jgi:hypothetical protein
MSRTATYVSSFLANGLATQGPRNWLLQSQDLNSLTTIKVGGRGESVGSNNIRMLFLSCNPITMTCPLSTILLTDNKFVLASGTYSTLLMFPE